MLFQLLLELRERDGGIAVTDAALGEAVARQLDRPPQLRRAQRRDGAKPLEGRGQPGAAGWGGWVTLPNDVGVS